MNRGVAASEVAVEHIGIEWSDRSHEHCHGLEALVESLVSGQITVPEARAVEAHIPVAEVVDHKIADGASRLGEFVVFYVVGHFFHE